MQLTRLASLTVPLLVPAMISGAWASAAPTDESLLLVLRREAAALAQGPPRQLEVELPKDYRELDYDGYRAIRPGPEGRHVLGERLAFEPLHLGGRYRTPVAVGVWEETGQGRALRPVPFDPAQFTGHGSLAPLDHGLGFAGVRVLSPQRRPDELAEFLVFHGASYFRAVGASNGFGASARALALGTADPLGEEFPALTRIILEAPADGLGVRVHGLIESDSLVGTLSMWVLPGEETVMEVEVSVFPRRELKSVGIAPLTSMFLFAKGRGPGRGTDFRSAVHDSDGLEMVTGKGERLWRPLGNPATLQVSAFVDDAPLGFGLMQRPRAFEAFGDLEARYERRPSVWVEPLGRGVGEEAVDGWGEGCVMLVEIPTSTEFNDNVVAFWRPATPLAAGVEHRFRYRLRWGGRGFDRAPLARVLGTSSGQAAGSGRRLFLVDFELPVGARGAASEWTVEAAAQGGRVLGTRWQELPTGAWRATLEFEPPEDAKVAELSLRLLQGGEVMGERWMYRWTP